MFVYGGLGEGMFVYGGRGRRYVCLWGVGGEGMFVYGGRGRRYIYIIMFMRVGGAGGDGGRCEWKGRV